MMAVLPSPPERRASRRITTRLAVRIRDAGVLARGHTVDMSTSGAFIHTDHLPALGATVALEIQFEDDTRRAEARVVRIFSVPFGEGGTSVTGFGVRFL